MFVSINNEVHQCSLIKNYTSLDYRLIYMQDALISFFQNSILQITKYKDITTERKGTVSSL